MNALAKTIIPVAVGAAALAAVSFNEASAGIPNTEAIVSSTESSSLVQHVWWHRCWHCGWGWHRWGWHRPWGYGWGWHRRWCYWHPRACGW
ncbi:MAG TPA: hypothetical protein VKV77_00330 [Methylovirgula sp.]|nr:hypothetical protein [Methylovirgula sp.]